jgi:hypothetical protein
MRIDRGAADPLHYLAREIRYKFSGKKHRLDKYSGEDYVSVSS